jgi:CRP-like cAMP-binding protein
MENDLQPVERVERLPADAILFHEGDAPKGAFVIHGGQVDLAFSSKKGLVRSLRCAGPGEIVGLEAVVTNQPHDCTATTATAANIGFVPKETLQEFLEANPSAWLTILRFLCNDVNACWDSMRTLTSR